MGTESESGVGHLDPLANLGIRARWSWRRVERRAVADHEQWLAAKLRGLAAAKVSVFGPPLSTAGQTTAGIVRLRLRGWHLLLAGVASGPRAELERTARQGRLRLDAAGRYGRFWWIEIVSDGAARGEKVVLLGSHLRLTPAGGGHGWAADIEETQGTAPNYPMIGDADFTVSKAYGMLGADVSGDPADRTAADNQTVRSVFVVGPDKKIKMIMLYPMTTGRNFDEILRVIDSLQLTAQHKVATPANWKQGEDVVIAGSVSNDQAKEIFGSWNEPKPYIRIVPQPS